ncbi:MAG: SDR family oxidoreductase [Candidatus Bathyarchaeia archaeon]
MIKITVFGATGGTGKQLVEQALAAGYEVIAYARDPSKLNITHERLTVVQGELTDQTLIENAIQGTEAVLSTLDPRGGSKNKPITQGIQNIIAAMKKQGVRRLIVTSTLSAKDPNDKPTLRTKAMVSLVKTTMRGAYEDIVSAAETVRSSNLDWTIVRLTMLNNDSKSGTVKVGYVGDGKVGTWISRADIADFMLKQVGQMKYVQQAPAISN